MISALKKLIHESERRKLLQFVGSLSAQHSQPLKILDVGCGYGANLAPLHQLGHQVMGAEINAIIVGENRKKSLQCFTPTELKTNGTGGFDLIVMSHVIEHFTPESLIKFVDEYLDLLKPNGHLLIVTPLLTDYFYDDFDHVKPYQPLGFKMVFSTELAQVQYYSRNKLMLKDLWFRKSFYRIHHARGRHIRSFDSAVLKLIDYTCIFFYLLTLRQFGKTDGWIGLFQKRESV